MSYDVYKAAILRVLPEAVEPPLEAPPAESFDLESVLECPACGCPDASAQQLEDVEFALCPRCQCEFTPKLESVSRKVIRRVSEYRQHRLRQLAERLPMNPPSGVDPVDYALFRDIVDEPEQPEGQPEADVR